VSAAQDENNPATLMTPIDSLQSSRSSNQGFHCPDIALIDRCPALPPGMIKIAMEYAYGASAAINLVDRVTHFAGHAKYRHSGNRLHPTKALPLLCSVFPISKPLLHAGHACPTFE